MHFAYYKLVTSTNPLTQRYYTLYTSAILLLQLYLLLAVTYHLRLITLPSPSSHSSHDDDDDDDDDDGDGSNGLDASFFFHVFLGWATSVTNVGRLYGHAGADSWDSYVRREFRVGRFDGVVAVAWTLPYVMLPFAAFGDYVYVGLTYLIPLPMILGYALAADTTNSTTRKPTLTISARRRRYPNTRPCSGRRHHQRRAIEPYLLL